MKIEYTLNVTQQEFYDYLMQSLIIDIFKNTEEFYLKENIHPGYIYKKQIKDKHGKKYDAIVEIMDIKEPFIYESKISVGSNSNIIKYECIQEDKTKVIYSEDMKSEKKINDMNYKIMSMLLKKSYQKKMNRLIMDMERHIQRSKE